jgi:hypothetical protein
MFENRTVSVGFAVKTPTRRGASTERHGLDVRDGNQPASRDPARAARRSSSTRSPITSRRPHGPNIDVPDIERRRRLNKGSGWRHDADPIVTDQNGILRGGGMAAFG